MDTGRAAVPATVPKSADSPTALASLVPIYPRTFQLTYGRTFDAMYGRSFAAMYGRTFDLMYGRPRPF